MSKTRHPQANQPCSRKSAGVWTNRSQPGDHIKRRLWACLCSDLGASLVEELVALAIMAVGVALLLTMIFTGSVGVTSLHDRVQAEALARSQLELITDSAYSPDPTQTPYPGVAAPTPYAVSASVEYWDAGTETFVPNVQNDGLQRLTVSVTRGGDVILSLQDLKAER